MINVENLKTIVVSDAILISNRGDYFKRADFSYIFNYHNTTFQSPIEEITLSEYSIKRFSRFD